jgi:hypothetical protein
MQIIDMAVTRRIVKIVPRQTTGISQGFYLKAAGMQFTVVRELRRRIFHTQLRMPVGFPSPHREQAPVVKRQTNKRRRERWATSGGVNHDTSHDRLYAGIVAVGATCDGAPIFGNKQDQLSAAWLGPSHAS